MCAVSSARRTRHINYLHRLFWLSFSNPASFSSVKDVREEIVFFNVLVILDDIPYPLIPSSVKLCRVGAKADNDGNGCQNTISFELKVRERRYGRDAAMQGIHLLRV